jgi:hypothetical protein
MTRSANTEGLLTKVELALLAHRNLAQVEREHWRSSGANHAVSPAVSRAGESPSKRPTNE